MHSEYHGGLYHLLRPPADNHRLISDVKEITSNFELATINDIREEN